MQFKNPKHISPFQQNKVEEIKKLAKHGHNPLRTSVHASGGSYRYNFIDIRNYFEAIKKSFDLVVR